MTTVTSKLQNVLTSSSFAFPTSYCLARVSYFLYICFFRACCSSVHTWYVHTSIYCGYNHRIFLLLFRIIQNCWFNQHSSITAHRTLLTFVCHFSLSEAQSPTKRYQYACPCRPQHVSVRSINEFHFFWIADCAQRQKASFETPSQNHQRINTPYVIVYCIVIQDEGLGVRECMTHFGGFVQIPHANFLFVYVGLPKASWP